MKIRENNKHFFLSFAILFIALHHFESRNYYFSLASKDNVSFVKLVSIY